jgi:hypothetical protein
MEQYVGKSGAVNPCWSIDKTKEFHITEYYVEKGGLVPGFGAARVAVPTFKVTLVSPSDTITMRINSHSVLSYIRQGDWIIRDKPTKSAAKTM